MVARLLLPPIHETTSLGERSSAVVLFDLGNTFSLLRLKDVMVKYIDSCNHERLEPSVPETLIAMVRDAMEHLHVFRPQSSLSLLASLSNLQSYLFNTGSHVSANRKLGAILLNDVDAFLWQDRLEDAEGQTIRSQAPHQLGLLAGRFRDLVAHLRRLQMVFSCLVITTCSALSTITSTRVDGLHAPILRSHLPSIWRNFAAVRLIVQRKTVRKFHHGVSAEEAAREAGQRREAVEKSTFSARLDWSESEAWRESTKSAIKAMENGAYLAFKITQDGVDFNVDD
ncbi:MAG: hypothetical protein Q9181_005586 [Wetmoreana brouardii]